MNTVARLVLVLAFALPACGGGGANSLFSRFGIRIQDHQIKFDDHIHFGSDSDEILDDSQELLDGLAQMVKDHPEIHTLRIDGHTDSTGDDAHNLELSQRRAQAVLVALQTRGVHTRMEARGLGETAPVCSEDTDDCHARNRRVEFVIVD